MTASDKMRLDEMLVHKGLAASRSRARDAILRGTVQVDGAVAAKPAAKVRGNQSIIMDDPAANYVSRAALKLIAGLDASGLDVTGKTALDIGASTGGFTQVLLERGARHVIALDVGHDQFHNSLRGLSTITLMEGVNARDLTADDLAGHGINVIVSDVSFISLKLALPPALSLAEHGADCVLLVKPQFEVGLDRIGKNGIVDPAIADDCADDLRNWLDTQTGWTAKGLIASPIQGGDGNREYLLWGQKA